ncbi:MAG: hypothetical protein M3R47_16750 [Chloroflexota bacterium]|nr:hypothetical protein [Chloroflexota bacterium]
MSEYQYYEWQTIDRSLNVREQAEVDRLSSHMDTVTSTQAIVTYSWGDFKHDPQKVLLNYFDAFLYDSNLGWRRLIFRLPKNLVDLKSFQPYLIEYHVMLEEHGKYFTIEIQFSDDSDYFEWVESGNVLGQLTPLREQLLQGDMRMLYLAWLKAVSINDPERAELEPPVPAGLKKLNASLQAFADFFEIDPHLISAAAGSSQKAESMPESDLESAILKLSREESDAHLLQILRGEPGAVLSLKKHLAQLGGGQPPSLTKRARATGELFKQAEKIEKEAERKAREEAERKRIQRLEKLAQEEESTWAYVENLLKEKRGKSYDEGTNLLAELRDMAKYKRRENQFKIRFKSICERYGKSIALMERFRRVGLMQK